MPNRQTQDQQPGALRNPGTFSPDDDEAQEADVTRADDIDLAVQGRPTEAAAEEDADLDEDEDEDDENDEDDADDEDEVDAVIDGETEDGSGGHV